MFVEQLKYEKELTFHMFRPTSAGAVLAGGSGSILTLLHKSIRFHFYIARPDHIHANTKG